MDLTLALVLTAAGATGAAALITTLIQVLKSAIPAIDNGKEKPLALVFSAIIVVLAVIDSAVFTLPALFGAFVAWLAIAKLATGIYDEVTQQPGSFTSGVDSP
jgi:hypothetical protein